MVGRPLGLFALYYGAGVVVVTALAWGTAASGVKAGPLITSVAAAVIAAAAGAGAHLRRPGEIILSAALATTLHLGVYYLPFLILLDARPNRFLLQEMGTIALGLLALYAVVLTATAAATPLMERRWTRQPRRTRPEQ